MNEMTTTILVQLTRITFRLISLTTIFPTCRNNFIVVISYFYCSYSVYKCQLLAKRLWKQSKNIPSNSHLEIVFQAVNTRLTSALSTWGNLLSHQIRAYRMLTDGEILALLLWQEFTSVLLCTQKDIFKY